MPDPSNNSFIPKRGPAKRQRLPASRQVYAFTIVSYVLMFATLLATGSVYLFGKYVDKKLQDEISLLNVEINSFSETDMKRVTDFDSRLIQASNRLENTVSIVSVFDALERATIDTVQLDSLSLVREDDEKFVLDSSIVTDSFDSAIFQRGVFQRNSVIEGVVINNVKTVDTKTDGKSLVTFNASIEVPLASVPYKVNHDISSEPMTIVKEPITSVGSTTEEEQGEIIDNEDNI